MSLELIRKDEQASAWRIPLQESSARILADKHLLPGETPEQMRMRIARAAARHEADPDRWEEAFHWVLGYAYPGGRIMANWGAEDVKPATSLINCTVSTTIPDSMEGIMAVLTEAAMTLKAGCGIGYDFSTLRPRGAYVAGAGASTSGPLPFMDVFDACCKTVSSAGGRRGAQMGVLDVGHPDIEEFILAKRQNGRLRAFNLSVLITEEFLQAVRADAEWPLAFPAFPHEIEAGCELIWRRWPLRDPRYRVNERGETACRVYRRVRARDLWQLIMGSTYEYSDPGFILIDRINEENPLWFAETIRATNPCGEQPLPPGGACLLGSVNLATLVQHPFSDKASFDWETFRQVVQVFSRLLDNVVEDNRLPVQVQRDEIARKRRHGMGFLGLGSALTMLGMPYGSPESVAFTERVARELAIESWKAGVALAREKGAAPILSEEFEITPEMLARRPEMAADGLKAGDRVPGRVLHARYSRYFQRLAKVAPELVADMAEHGARYTHATSIAPTGTMAAGIGNNASNGIEPSFTHFYYRNMIVPGKKTKERIPMYSYELLAWREFVDPEVDPENLPEAFAGSTSEVDPMAHLAIQAAAQKWVDSAISKTINLPTDISREAVENLYLEAAERGLKGCTTFRFNPDVHQGVLVKPEDLARTTYAFKLADGTEITARGDELIEYDGEVTTAANLYEALKEGTYGRF